ncbi:GDP-L-fucose synthase [Spirochaetia bacterium]|nr:GDP-L-fucose synthase [Spirochaetia bacterium]
MNKNAKIYIAGHKGLVGNALFRNLKENGYTNIVTKTHTELDLINQPAVESFFTNEKPEYVFLTAAKVGGIGANSTYPADFIYKNMLIGFNVIHAAYKAGVKKLLNLGSSCIYPKMALQPLKEEYLLTGPLESTNEAYAVAKIAVIKLCSTYNKQYGTNFLSAMPTNLYGIGDNYDPENAHVLPAMIQKIHEAKILGKKEVVLWGDGTPLREFLYSDDLANVLVSLMEHCNAHDLRNEAGDFINIGSGQELSIRQLAETIRDVVYDQEFSVIDADPTVMCKICWDITKPNGTQRKLCDTSRLMALGYNSWTPFQKGIKIVYNDFLTKREHENF